MIDLLIPARLIVAHLIGDFVLQPNSWVEDRKQKKYGSLYLYLHGLVHFCLVLCLNFDRNYIWAAAAIGAGHIILDGAKAYIKEYPLNTFMIDQILHLGIILVAWMLLEGICPGCLISSFLQHPVYWWILAGYLLNIFMYPRLIAIATEKWRAFVPPDREILYKAGRWIGIIERCLIFTFILLGQFSAVGFLLAAKSIFRFGDLRESRDKGHTEYVLIGSLLSFSLAVFTALIVHILARGQVVGPL